MMKFLDLLMYLTITVSLLFPQLCTSFLPTQHTGCHDKPSSVLTTTSTRTSRRHPISRHDDLVHRMARRMVAQEEAQDDNNIYEMDLAALENRLCLIEALEERNKAQIYSFIDEDDQWESLEEEERQLLLSKGSVVERIRDLTSSSS